VIPIVEVESVLISSTGNYLLVNTSSGALAVRIVDGSGIGITSTDIGSGHRALDVNAAVTGSALTIIRDPNVSTRKVTVKDETAVIPDVYSLDVNIRSGILNTVPTGNNIIYDKLTADLAIANGGWTQTYYTTSTGNLFYFVMSFSTNNIDIRVTVDGNVIANSFNLNDIQANYTLDIASTRPMLPQWLYTFNSGTSVAMQFGANGCIFDTSFKIEAKAYLNGKKMIRGLVVRAV